MYKRQALAGSSVFFIWQFLFSGDAHGFINGALMNIGLIKEPIQWLTDPAYNFGVLVLVQLWMCLGTGFLAFIAGFKGIDTSLYEAGSIDGVRNRLQELFYITLPMMKPQLLFGAGMQIRCVEETGTACCRSCGPGKSIGISSRRTGRYTGTAAMSSGGA